MAKKKKTRIHEAPGFVISRWLIRIFLIAWAICVAFPVIWALYTSLKSNQEFFSDPWGLPSTPQWQNFVNAWDKANFGEYFFNTLIIVAASGVFSFAVVPTTAYVLAKYRGKLTKGLELFYTFAMMIPTVLSLVPMYYLCSDITMYLGIPLTDSLISLGLIYSITGMPYYVILMSGFIRSINNSLIEAAQIDGATQFGVFFRVILPLVKPSLYMIMLLNLIGNWNEFTTALTFLTDPTKYTIAIGISYLTSSGTYDVDYGRTFAGLAIALVPILILYAIFNRQLQEGMSSEEGVK